MSKLFINPYKVIREEAEETSAENFGDSQQVKDVVAELDDAMENIPAISGEPVESNGQPVDTTELKVTAEMVSLIRHESAGIHGTPRTKYLVDAAEAVDQVAAANTDVGQLDSGETVDVDIDSADVVVIAPPAEEVKEIVAAAQQEAAHGFKGLATLELALLTRDLSNKKVNWRKRS